MMAVRLLEMRRVLKNTGSIYLHCDPTAGHYLKSLMGSLVEMGNFRNQIIWHRSGSHNFAKRFGPIHDVILFYSKSDEYEHKSVFTPYLKGHVETFFKRKDENGHYWTNSIHGSGTRQGESGQPWRCFDPTTAGRHWAISRDLVTAVGIDPDLPQHKKLDALYELGLFDLPQDSEKGLPTYRQYLDRNPGQLLQDIRAFQPHTKGSLFGTDSGIDEDVRWTPPRDKKERIDYPTQKPLGLLERIIKASSNEGDMVLDPFCGCSKACVAADNLGRQWVGIDLSEKAVELVNMRLQQSMGSLFHHGYVTAHTDIPRRTDIETPIPYRQNRHVLFGLPEGRCNGCKTGFPFRAFDIDHIVPQSRGGTDHLDNLQLLSAHCNRTKGDRTQEYLIARLMETGITA